MNRGILYITLLAVLMISGCNNERKRNIPTDIVTNPKSASGEEKSDLPRIEFEREIFDFGKLIQGEKATYGFEFTNTGDSELVISQVNSSCGCTVPKFPRKPIAPGEKGKIKVTFDSSGRSGIQNKTVTVVSNCQPNHAILRIKAMVLEP